MFKRFFSLFSSRGFFDIFVRTVGRFRSFLGFLYFLVLDGVSVFRGCLGLGFRGVEFFVLRVYEYFDMR